MLRSFIDSELAYGLAVALDAEIVTAILADAVAGPGGDPLTAARKAITLVQQADLVPTAFVRHRDRHAI